MKVCLSVALCIAVASVVWWVVFGITKAIPGPVGVALSFVVVVGLLFVLFSERR